MEIKNELWENQGEKSICKKAMWTEIFSIPRENLAGASTKSAVGKHCKGQNGKYIKLHGPHSLSQLLNSAMFLLNFQFTKIGGGQTWL